MSYLEMVGPELYTVLIAILLAMLWWLFFIEYKQYRIDFLRQRLFQIRSILFFKAQDADLFHTPAYGLTRTTLNGAIRFAHEFGLARIVVGYSIEKVFGGNAQVAARYYKALVSSLEQLPEPHREAVVHTLGQFHVAVLSHIAKTSLILAPVFYIARPIVRTLRLVNKCRAWLWGQSRRITSLWAYIDAEANEVGREAATGGSTSLTTA